MNVIILVLFLALTFFTRGKLQTVSKIAFFIWVLAGFTLNVAIAVVVTCLAILLIKRYKISHKNH